ncbi:MAG: hypothetical protein ACRD23_02720 [Terriglobales bacterium]
MTARLAGGQETRGSLASMLLVHSALLLTAVFLFTGKAEAQDSGCKPVIDAAVLQARTPSHVYSSMTGPGTNLTMETITTSSFVYTRSNVGGADPWKKTKYLPEDEARQAASSSGAYTSCQHVGDETINGEMAAIYTEVSKKSGVSGKAWISKKSGLPLKGELTLSSGHVSIRYEYDNVRPPGMRE